jgi:hypothetical protein
MMKKSALFLVFGFHVLYATAQSWVDKEPFLTKTFANQLIKIADVKTSGGNITVTAVSEAETRVEVFIRSSRGVDLSKDEIQKRLNDKYELIIALANEKLTAIAKNKSRDYDWKKSLSISFRVFVPREVSSNLATSGGSISITGISGNQDFTTSGGSLHVDNVTGKIRGVTSGGSITLNNSADDIELTTSGGGIVAKNNKGKMKLVTSGGSLVLEQLAGTIDAATSGGSISGEAIGGMLHASTSGGSITLKQLTCSINAATSAGSIDVSMKELGQYVKLETSAGNIKLEIPKSKGVKLELYADKITTAQLEDFSGKITEDELNGTLNGGGILITAKANGGKISLALK